jgi:YteA family regulatory protein
MNEHETKTRLLKERTEIEDQISYIQESGMAADQRWSFGELSFYDNHPADLGSETFERSKDLGLRDNLVQMRKQIDHALERLEQGQYGICEKCHRPIDEERLQAVPSATECLACREEDESHDDDNPRPLEEKLLDVPFARTWTREKNSTAYDGEDALQEATRYGTSETNQDYPGSHGPDDCFENADELQGVVFPEEAYVAQDLEGHEFQMDPEVNKKQQYINKRGQR